MDAADQIGELPQMMRDVGPPSLSSNPCLRGTPLPIEDHSEEAVKLRRSNGDKNNSEIPVQLRRGSGDKGNSEIPLQLRRGSSDKDSSGNPLLLRRGSGDGEIPVQLRRGRRGSADIEIYESKRASWGYCGSRLLKARPLDLKTQIEVNKSDGPSETIPESVENIDETEKDGSSQSLAKNIENKHDSIKNRSPRPISASIETEDEKSKSTQTGNSIIEKIKRKSIIEN